MFAGQEPTENTRDFFKEIYQAAIDENIEGLHKLRDLVSLDLIKKMHMTPAAQLAYEGNHKAINFLIAHGNVSLMKIAYGYALGNYVQEAYRILDQAIFTDRNGILKNMILGFSQAQNKSETLKILNGANEQQRFAFLVNKACGEALSGREIPKDEIIELLQVQPDNKHAALVEIIYHYGLSHHSDFAINLLKFPELHRHQQIDLLCHLITGSAHGQDIEAVKNILTNPNYIVTNANVYQLDFFRAAIKGFAQAWDIENLTEILIGHQNFFLNFPLLVQDMEKKGIKNLVVQSLAESGNAYEAYRLAKELYSSESIYASLDGLVQGFALGKHVYHANEVLANKNMTTTYRLECANLMMYAYLQEGFTTEAFQLFSLLEPLYWPQLFKSIVFNPFNLGALFIDEETTLQILATIKDEALKKAIVEQIQSLETLKGKDISALIHLSTQIYYAKKKHPQLSFEKALYWVDPVMSVLFLQMFPQMLKEHRINVDIIFRLLPLFNLPQLSLEQAKDLEDQFSLHFTNHRPHRLRLFAPPPEAKKEEPVQAETQAPTPRLLC